MKSWFWSVLLVLTLSTESGCKKRAFHEENTKSSLQNAASRKAHGGAFNFQIAFAPVDEATASDFWLGNDNAKSYSHDVASHAKKTGPFNDFAASQLYVFGEKTVAELIHPSAAQEIDSLVRNYFRATNRWLKLACGAVDMNAALSGKFAFAGPRQVRISESDAVDSCQFVDVESQGVISTAQVLAEETIWSPGPEKPVVTPGKTGRPEFGMGILQERVQDESGGSLQPSGLIVFAPFYTTVNGKRVQERSLGIPLLIVGNYIYPMHSWAHSKAFAVPVMKFDGDRKSPNFLKPVAFYDFGMLLLMSLPEKGNILASRMAIHFGFSVAMGSTRSWPSWTSRAMSL